VSYRLVTIDFESEFYDDFSLTKESTESYVRSPRFRPHGAAIKWTPDHKALWYAKRELRSVLADEDWSDVYLLAHHMNFDGLILSHHYNVIPAMYGCTLCCSRLLLGNHLSVSLDAVRQHFNMSLKRTPYSQFKNKRWEELTPQVQELMADGACDEVESIFKLFVENLLPQMPQEELEVIDSVTSMFCNPVLRADTQLLADVWQREAIKKQNGLAELNLNEADLQSADRFADLLREEGVDPERKHGKNGEIYAFAKTDQFMRDLLEHDNDRVRLLAETRLGVKSTIQQTRAETLGWMASRGPLPVYLRYAGAGTLRVSGGDGANWLNFKRGSDIRKSIMAPEGFVLCPIDSSQIEARCLHYLAGGPDEPVIQRFRNGEDPYVDLASRFYGKEIYKPAKNDPRREEMEAKRGMGKQGRLMCGYGASGKQFKITAKNGLYGPPVDISIEDATSFVTMYRETNPSICGRPTGLWPQCEHALRVLNTGATMPLGYGGILTCHLHKIWLPSGQMLHYDSLEWHVPPVDEECRDFEREGYWRLKTRQGWKKMWGSKLTQNLCEAVSRVIVSQAMIRIKRMGFRTLNWPYDELLLLLPKDGHEEKNAEACAAEMKREVSWLPGLPLDCEYVISERYAK